MKFFYIIVCLFLVSCSQEEYQTLSTRSVKIIYAKPAMLQTTWIIDNEPPKTVLTPYDTFEHCLEAKREEDRIADDARLFITEENIRNAQEFAEYTQRQQEQFYQLCQLDEECQATGELVGVELVEDYYEKIKEQPKSVPIFINSCLAE